MLVPANVNQPQMDWYREVPRSIRKQSAIGAILLSLAFGGFGTWAATAPLAAAIITQGSFVATGQNKIVQHLEGGIIKEILVSEGDEVKEGQPLVVLDGTAARTNDRQFFLRLARLEAINARLIAETRDIAAVPFPAYLSALRDDQEVVDILTSQTRNFEGSRNKMGSEISMLRSNIRSMSFRADGYDGQRKSMERQLGFLKDEFVGKQQLLVQGLIRKNEISALSRAIADAEGQIGRLQAELDQTLSERSKIEEQIEQTKAIYRQAALDELQSIEADLDEVREQRENAESILKRTIVKAPVSGTIVRLHYHTAGGVIESGKSIVEILPAGVPLIIETQIPRTDIDAVRTGQHAVIRLTALNQRITPILNGEVTYVSADSLPDPKGNAVSREVYIARISLPASELLRVKGFSPTPGMPAEVMIQTAERTFVEYIARPITDSMSRAFREQ
jgi:HlyD family type I secretion membrane fusion protein